MLLVFSDESGIYNNKNWYIRASFIINDENYLKLVKELRDLKKQSKIPLNKELKYNCLYPIKKFQEKESDKVSKDCNPLVKIPYKTLINFVTKSLELIQKYDISIIIIFSFLDQKFKSQIEIEKDYLKTLMLRIEPQAKYESKNAVLIFDDINKNTSLCEAYEKIYTEADFVKEYSKIKDSISFDISKFSCGIQIADFIAGVTHSFLRNYSEGTDLFSKYIFNNLRTLTKKEIFQTGFIPLYFNKKPELLNKIKLKIKNIT